MVIYRCARGERTIVCNPAKEVLGSVTITNKEGNACGIFFP